MSELSNQRPMDDLPGGGPDEPGPAGDITGGTADELPIGERLGRNPGNLGDDVADRGDITHPTPDPGGPQM